MGINSLDIKKFTHGKCFLCGEECKEYIHSNCAIAYADEKEKRLKEANQKLQ
jgi:hypothetical protein